MSMHALGMVIDFEDDCILLDGKKRGIKREIKAMLNKGIEEKWIKEYLEKQMQSQIFQKWNESCYLWLSDDCFSDDYAGANG